MDRKARKRSVHRVIVEGVEVWEWQECDGGEECRECHPVAAD